MDRRHQSNSALLQRLFARVTIKTWQKPETALEESLAPRVRSTMTENKTDCLKLIFGILTNHAQEMEVRSQMQYKYPFIHRCPKLTSSHEKSYRGNAIKPKSELNWWIHTETETRQRQVFYIYFIVQKYDNIYHSQTSVFYFSYK